MESRELHRRYVYKIDSDDRCYTPLTGADRKINKNGVRNILFTRTAWQILPKQARNVRGVTQHSQSKYWRHTNYKSGDKTYRVECFFQHSSCKLHVLFDSCIWERAIHSLYHQTSPILPSRNLLYGIMASQNSATSLTKYKWRHSLT